MAVENDGIDEAVEGQLRVLVTVAGQMAERMVRARAESLRQAEASSERETRELRTRFKAERSTAVAELHGVDRPQWWDNANPEQIGRSYRVARAWEQEDSDVARAVSTVREQVRERYGIDVTDAGADPDQVRQLLRLELDRAERDRAAADAERARASRDNVEAATLLTHAAQQDRDAESTRAAAEHEPNPAERDAAIAQAERSQASADTTQAEAAPTYDSAARRAGTAKELEDRGLTSEEVAARMQLDVTRGKPAADAVKTPGRAKVRGRTSPVNAAARSSALRWAAEWSGGASLRIRRSASHAARRLAHVRLAETTPKEGHL